MPGRSRPESPRAFADVARRQYQSAEANAPAEDYFTRPGYSDKAKALARRSRRKRTLEVCHSRNVIIVPLIFESLLTSQGGESGV
jgi:hypothetical protein